MKHSKFSISNWRGSLLLAWLFSAIHLHAAPAPGTATVRSEPLHSGRISPMLFGNFIELLDDVAPAMWAEMLNDRSFEGVVPAANFCYFDGKPDICDRTWDTNGTWYIDTINPFNGSRCARVSAAAGHPRTLTQSGLAAKKDMEYVCSGYFRTDAKPHVSVALKTLLPDGTWMTLASAKFPQFAKAWEKYSVRVHSRGTTDRVVFELRAEGKGSVWADKLSLMPADNVEGWRQDVIQAVRDVHPGLVRWGGSACDPGGYRWKNGVGDRDLRTPFLNKPWGRLDPNDVGVDEFCRFCEAVVAEPLICVSFSDGAQSAADLVEYCNGPPISTWGSKRAANGHPAPYHVKYWQIGNEISGNDANYYGNFGDFVRLMKQADPGAKLMTSYPAQQMLTKFGSDLFCVCPHHYTPDLAACDRDFDSVAKMIDNTPGCEGVKIAVTEWNISGGDWGLGRGRQWTLASALLNARYLHVLMRHSDKANLACRSNMANSYCGAIFETDPAGVLKRPSYLVMQLYATHAKPVPLRINQTDGGPDCFACASEDGKSLTLFCVNLKHEPMEWAPQFEGFATAVKITSAESVHDSQDAGQPDITNHWESPERVKTTLLSLSENTLVLPPLSATAIECEVR